MHTRHKYQGEDLAKREDAFRKIAKDYPLKKKYIDYDIDKEFIALDTECKLVCDMYKLNDFVASSYAYSFTMRKIEEMLDYCYRNMSDAKVMQWCNTKSSISNVRQNDGSVKGYGNLGYLYEHLRKQQMSIAARYFIEYNIQYLELDKGEKDYPSRRRILESAIWWVNQGLLGRFGLKMPFTPKEYSITPQVVIFSTFPSSGKSYLVNTAHQMFIELNAIINDMGGVLRVGNEQGNIFRQSRQTMNMIENTLILDVYPENKEFINKGSYRPFDKSSEEEWTLNGVKYDPSSSVFKTRDSAINSVRCKFAVMDDPSRGQQESTNVKIHNDIVQLYRGDFSDRFKNQDDKFIILTGTMFNPYDVFSLEIQDSIDGAKEDKRFKNTYISKDNKTIIIVNDCENEYGMSAYPEFISDESLAKKRNGLDPYDYACVWRQRPIPPEGLIFDYDFLKKYSELPKLEDFAFAYVDPTRRSAKDYFSMPICKYCSEDDNYYMIDCIYEQKSAIDLTDSVIEKIKKHKIIKIVIEENIDGSLIERIKDKLENERIKWCQVVPIYNTVSKARRIALMAQTVKNCIVFPDKNKYSSRHPMSMIMRDFTQYTTVGSNVHDDSPDSICGFAEHLIYVGDHQNKITFRKKSLI